MLKATATALAMLTLAAAAEAQVSIDWYTIDCGGGTSTGGGLSLSGTIGQFDAGAPMTGGSLSVQGGFWAVPPFCPGDFNGDGQVNTQDLTLFLIKFGQNVGAGVLQDMNGDGVVNTQDLTLFLIRFGRVC